jgi:hypothetical protein
MANPGQTVLRLVGRIDRRPTGSDGRFVVDYDPRLTGPPALENYKLVTTPDITKARGFPDRVEATDYWKQVCPNRPRRDDGRPHRPLAAFTVVLATVPESEPPQSP